jgi:hypothetical protein
MPAPRKYEVRPSAEQRERLEGVTRNGRAPAKKIRHARVLLMSDRDHPAGRWHDAQIAAASGMHLNTVARVRKRFVLQGEAPALDRKPRLTPPVPPKIDGRVEAHLVAVCCSPPPAGRACWTMRLLADELVARRLVASISAEAVRLRLKKRGCRPRGGSSASASPSGRAAGSSRAWRKCSTSTPRRTRRTPATTTSR